EHWGLPTALLKHWGEEGGRAGARTPGSPPLVTVFSEDPVELGDPNILICYVDKFWPSVITITWLRNGFRKFSYLPFIPTRGDYYDCRVEHWGLPTALLKHWGEE
uniref:Ig-like domain-containing protein n=1 Tax=Buteo japonicus TaxID=224669 RepID=A0A8C0ASM9_9AVES